MELVVAQSINDFASLEKLISTSTDILVLDQSAMVVLDSKGVKYKVIEDFYSADQYYQDICVFRKSVRGLLKQLDEACSVVTDFPYAYSGNGLYTSMWLDNIFYLDKIIQAIQGKYKKVYLYAVYEPKKISVGYLKFSRLNSRRINGTISLPLGSSIELNIQLIYNSIDMHFVKDASCMQKNLPAILNLKFFTNKVQGYINRRFFRKIDRKDCNIELKEKSVYIIQDGHEVLYLKKYLPKFKFLNPVTQLRQDIEIEHPIDMADIPINYILKYFVREYFIFLDSYIYLLINSYHLEIVGRIRTFKESFKCQIKKDNPSLLFLSSGTRDVFDTICCQVANYYNIPVIVFQHGGHSLFTYEEPYQENLEYSKNIFKFLILQSKQELAYVQNNQTKTICMGSIRQYEENRKSDYKAPVKDIIFCLGPDTNLVFRNLLNYYSTNKKHQQSIDIINTAEDVSLSVDVKLHPAGERDSYYCYKDIIKNNQYKNIDVLYGSFGEVVLKNYKLIIIDFLGSALTKHIFCLKIPVIIYDCDFDKIRVSDSILSDIYRRCYIARNKNELRELLERYKAENLPSKWSVDFIDKYIYPVDNGSPGENIAKYVCNIIK